MAVLTDDQMHALFAQEAGVRLATLSRLLLALEPADTDTELVDSLFRELHTIKGSAAVVGLADVSSLAHELESLVETIRGGAEATPAMIDSLLAGVDGLSRLINRPGEQPSPVAPAPREEPSPVALLPRARAATTDGTDVVMVPLERLDELTRLVSESASAHLRVGRMVSDRFATDPSSVAEFNALSRLLNDLQDRAMRVQMVPVSTITDVLQRTVRDLGRAQGKEIRWDARGTDTELDRGVLRRLSDSLLHLVRNAVDHGVEMPDERTAAGKPRQATIRLHAMQLGSEVIIAVTDDGRGVDLSGVRDEATRQGVSTDGLSDDDVAALTLRSGLSTASFVTDVSGRGVGLDVVRTNVEAARGRIEVRSQPGHGAEFRVIVPITLAVLRCLLVRAGGHSYALPFHRVVRSQVDHPSERAHAEGRPVVWVDGQAVPLSVLSETLGGPSAGGTGGSGGPIVVLSDSVHRHAFTIDGLVGQRDVVLKGLSRALPSVPAVAGASVEPDGAVLLVLDPPGLIHRARSARPADVAEPPGESTESAQPVRSRVLVVDDALTVRELQRSILERAGFEVRVAGDGIEALALLAEDPSDLVLTDVEMPLMDGFALTEAIRRDDALANIPVLILSSRSSETDRRRGLEVGADGYIVKSRFDEDSLLSAVHRLLGGQR